MQNAQNLIVNHLPVRTWNRLRMNDASVSLHHALTPANAEVSVPDEILHDTGAEQWNEYEDIQGALGKEAEALLTAHRAQAAVHTFESAVPAGRDAIIPVIRLALSLAGEETGAALIGVTAREGAGADIIMDFRAKQEASGNGGEGIVSLKVRAKAGSLVRITQIYRAGQQHTILSDIGAVCDEEARVEVIHIVMDAANTILGARVDLLGKESSFQAQTGYRVTGQGRLDMNYIANHFGRKTRCDMNALGVLREDAFKLYRGTIDFRQGSAGAVGNEKEDVLLMDEGVVNQTIPLILCAEEDVEGNHGATIGELDENTMFYLRSRGIPEEEVYRMLEKGRIASVIAKIPDESTKEALLEEL